MPETDPYTAAQTISGAVPCDTIFARLGPGITYHIELPSGRPTCFSQTENAFPPAFYKLLESIASWEEIVVEANRETYRSSIDTKTFQSEARYRILINRRGETLPIVDYRELVRDESGKPIAVAGRIVDDSFRSVAFDSLARRSWQEIATTMSKRFLHDFNNTIAGIYSLSELYAEPGSDPKSTAEAMGHIRDCSIRAQNLTRKIRQLTNLEVGTESYFDLKTLIEEQREYMEALLPKGASIEIEAEDGEHPIRLDPNLFRQAILHLTGNASDACGENVEIQITLSQSEQNDQRIATLAFKDNGPGFKPPELENALTPFFTTKDSDKHPGLGLSIVAQFVDALGGSIQLSNTGNGATVILTLTLLEKESPATAKTYMPTGEKGSPTVKASKAEASAPNILIYSWEDISRHPLILAMDTAGWETRIHLEPGDLLLDLLQKSAKLDGVLVFKSALDEKAEPLISELDHARDGKKIALIALGESPDTLSVSTKRHCGLIASGTSKPSALLSKLLAYFSQASNS